MIKVSGLQKKFGDFVAVEDLNFEVLSHEIFGLLGPNGAGKTTTISMICGLLPQSAGNIEFDSESRKDIKSLIGYCPQENIYYHKLTCFEQLVFMGRLYKIPSKQLKARAKNLLDLLGFAGVFRGV